MTPIIRNVFLVLIVARVFGFSVTVYAQESKPGWTANPDRVESLQARERERNRKINYREENVPDYVLPDPLRMLDGTKVESAEAWKAKRRPEILELFRKNVYGRAPVGRPEGMTFDVFDFDPKAMDGRPRPDGIRLGPVYELYG